MVLKLIDNSHIESWAGSRAAQGDLPRWVQSLIQAVVNPSKLRMPSGDAVWVPGFDGVVFSDDTNLFVPTGASVWEIGTTDTFKVKAQTDYDKRRVDKSDDDGKPKLVVNRPETVFVFVTPWIWKDKANWERDRKAEGVWKDVRVIDGVDFKDWLNSAPAVALRFVAENSNHHTDKLWTVDQAWDEWSRLSKPPISEDFVTAGREEQVDAIIGTLAEAPDTITVRADSPREAWGFVLAAIRKIPDEADRNNILSRTIVAEDENVGGLRNVRNLIIVLKQVHGQVSGVIANGGCHVIIPQGNDYGTTRRLITLARPTLRPVVEAIRKMLCTSDDEQAERLARACGLNVTIFQRQEPDNRAQNPAWAEKATALPLIPALMAGRWDSRNIADQNILANLADAPDYNDVSDQLHALTLVDEPPLRKIDNLWTLSSSVDAFQLVACHLRSGDLNRFKAAFIEVFSRIDPQIESSAPYRTKDRTTHSDWLRSGLAETLLLIAERGPAARINLENPRSFADEIVRSIPGLGEDWRVLASLRDQYAKLMEAAPLPLLNSLECLLGAHPGDVARLFADGAGMFGRSFHTGVLWGLEMLAWDPKFLMRVSLLLAKLAAIDPGGRMANRPINSLREIFLWWHPGTSADLALRLSAIDQILNSDPIVGWSLLEKLLPQWRSSMSFPSHTPRWRDFGDLSDDLRTPQGQALYMEAIVDRALDRVGSDSGRWHAVLDALRMVGPVQGERAFSLLAEVSRSNLLASTRMELWTMLRDFIAHHRSFHSTDWVLPHDALDSLEAILPALAPADPVEKLRWLFDAYLPDLPEGHDDIKESQKRVDELRVQAVAEILGSVGVSGLVRLGTSSKMQGIVASIAVPQLTDLAEIQGFIDQAMAAGEPGIFLASHVSAQALGALGGIWRTHILQHMKAATWPASVAAALVAFWPDSRTTWDDIAALGPEIADEYWRRKSVHLFQGRAEDQIYQSDRLLAAKRAIEVFHSLSMSGKSTPSAVLVQVFDAAMGQLVSAQGADEIRRVGIQNYDISQFLAELRSRPDISRDEIALREYRVLPLLGWRDASGLTIHEFMANDPGFFVEILCDVFLPASRDRTLDDEPSPEVLARAKVGHKLLQGMKVLPGQGNACSIDEGALATWIESVRTLAIQNDRAVVADLKIGDLLAHAPNDPDDGAWPHRVIRSVISRFRSDDIDRGLIIERHNMRGATSRGIFDGGAQERVLAAQYRNWAETSRPNWHRMAAILENIAESWDREAKREDDQAEQSKLDLG